MKYLFSFLLVFSITCSFAQQKNEQELSLNGEWAFRIDPDAKGERQKWFCNDLADSEWETMQVPGNWDLKNEYAHYAGTAWYRRTLVIPTRWEKKCIRLLFEAVHFQSKVWLNGIELGVNDIGYLPFEFDVSKIIRFNAKNTIVVKTDNTYRLGALWNWGGIRRPVKLVATEKTYIASQLITPTVDLLRHTGQVYIKLRTNNKGVRSEHIAGELELSNEAGFKKIVPFSITIPAGAEKEIILRTTINKNDLHLWDTDDPFLYQSAIYINQQGKRVHQLSDRFGFRKIEIDSIQHELKLNGKAIRPLGFNWVPDDRTTGNTLPLWRVKQDIDLMKSMGVSMARLSHLPLHKEVLDYLDEKGILIFSEIPVWGMHLLADKNNPLARQWMSRLVAVQQNHACIMGWSVGNEIGQTPGVNEYTQDAIEYVKQIDTAHLAVVVSHTATRPRDILQYSDLGMINKYGRNIGRLADETHALYPNKLLFYSEYGYNQLRENLDTDADAKAMLDSIRLKPFLVGASLWTFNDYRSNYTGTIELSENRAWGIVDVFRQKKKAWYSFRKEYAPVSNLHVAIKNIGQPSAITVTLKPRRLYDLPANPLKGYRLLWEGFDANGQMKAGGISPLPDIFPGDTAGQYQFIVKETATLAHIKVLLLSANNYVVADTSIWLKKINAPRLLSIQSGRMDKHAVSPNTGQIRIEVNKSHPTQVWKIKYSIKDGMKDGIYETAYTMNNFTEIPRLDFEKEYQIALISKNNYADTSETITTDYPAIILKQSLLPPLVYYIEPADKGFYIGYITEPNDYVYKVQYTTKTGDYARAETIQSSTKGVLFVPVVANGIKYYFRICRVFDNNNQSAWSQEYSIVPDGGGLPSVPVVKGVIRNEGDAVIVFDPVKKAIGYTVQFKKSGDSNFNTIYVSGNDISHFTIKGLSKKDLYEFRMSSKNENGYSLFSAIITQ